VKKFLCLGFAFFSIALGKPQAQKLLESADRARGGILSGATWTMNLQSTEGKHTQEQEFKIFVLGDDARAECLAPLKSKGQVMLFNEKNMWFYKPGLKKPISFSKRQKLSGMASYGDIANTHYVRDYQGEIVGEEKVKEKETWVVELISKSEDTTYDKIKYWIEKNTELGIQAEFYSKEGTLLKKASMEYGNFIESQGKKIEFIKKMIIEDATFKENKSVLIYSGPKQEDLPKGLFQIQNLNR